MTVEKAMQILEHRAKKGFKDEFGFTSYAEALKTMRKYELSQNL